MLQTPIAVVQVSLPMFHTKGIRLNALGCSSLKGTISATVVLIMPTLPLPAPCNALATIANGKLLLNPQSKLISMVEVKPRRMAGLRPYRSEKRPHGIPIKAWKSEKTAAHMPAHFPTSFCGIPNDSTISGRYGYSEVEARGSAKRHIAMRSIG